MHVGTHTQLQYWSHSNINVHLPVHQIGFMGRIGLIGLIQFKANSMGFFSSV